MDKIGSSPNRLLSTRVVGGRYFFLNLAPKREVPFAITLGGREKCRPDYAVDRRRFAYLGLEYVAEGSGWVSLDGRRHALEPGSVFAWGRETHCRIETEPARPMVKYFICLTGTEAEARLKAAGLAVGQTRTLASHGEIRSIFEDIIREGQHHGAFSREICLTLFSLLALKIRAAVLRNPRREGSESARESFSRCKALIDSEAERLATLEEISSAVGVEASSICRLFRRFQGTSPYQYLLRRKMTIAAAHLVENGCLVKEAALQIGFEDPYHFSRCFKAIHGIAPRDLLRYRRAG